ncbi:hypothetical protein [Halobaculum sp. P14]|uniref:hypothetical protein n=1 Tax=Halobaculum sp. P14 TaxID=3421638 RepID=UPI003EB8E30D
MVEWLFPNWSSPVAVAAVVAAKAFLNAVLTARTAALSGEDSRAPFVAGGLTVCSTVLAVFVLRGTLGLAASYLEVALQAALLVLVAVVTYSAAENRRLAVTVPALLAAAALLLVTIPLYGEATVAP